MGRKSVKLAWVENENSRTVSLKKRREGLVKKVKEITILCDVKACLILFSPNEVEPMVWPSVEKACDLLDSFFSLAEIEKKKETSLESYLKKKTEKVHQQLMKTQKKNMNSVIDQLMRQLHHGHRIEDLNLSEIFALISFSKDNVILYRKGLDFAQYPPLRDPPIPPFEMQFEGFVTTRNDVFVKGGREDERAWNTGEEEKRINLSNAVRGNQSYYLIDQWFFPSSEPLEPKTHQPIEMDVVFYNKNQNPIPYQGNSINENPNLEMEPVEAPVITFHGLGWSASQPLQHHSINNTPTMAMSQPSQYPFDFMSREIGAKEKGDIVNNSDSQFHRRSNTFEINNGIRKEPPPNEATAGEDNDDVALIDINKVWPDINNNHF